MAKLRALQTAFNAGVIDPLAHGRADLAQYYRGVKRGENVVPSTRGGLKRRGGFLSLGELPKKIAVVTPLIATAPNGGTAGNATDDDPTSYLVTTAAIGTTTPYVVVHFDMGYSVTVAFADVVNFTVSSGSTTEFAIQYSTDNITWTTLQGNLGTIYTENRTHRRAGPVTARYWRVAKVGGTDLGAATASIGEFNLWTQTAYYGNSRIMEFAFSADQRYALVFTDYNADIYRDGIYKVSVRTPYNSNALPDLNWAQSADVMILVHHDAPPQELARYTDTDWQFSTINLTNIPTYDYGSGPEPVISSSRGWPGAVTFYEDRLWFAGLKSRTATLLSSKTSDYYNLDVGTGLDDESIFRTLDADQLNEIRHIKSGRHLQVFTTGDEFFCPVAPITPGTVVFSPQSSFGISAVRPETLDGATYFLQYTGNVIREFVYNFAEDAYLALPATLMSSHLIRSPVDMASQAGTLNDDANYLYAVNSDGTMAVFNRLRTAEVAAWYLWTTAGNFKQVASIETDLYVVVERTINGTVVQFVEKYSADAYTDCALQGTEATPTDTITGLDHLNGEECRVRGDGSVLANVTPSGGSATLETAVTDWEIGLEFNPLIETMPLNVDLQDGPMLSEYKRIIRAVVQLDNSLGVFINGNRLPDRKFGEVLDTAPTPFTGFKEVFLMGWTREATVVITQADPVPFNILSLTLEMEA